MKKLMIALLLSLPLSMFSMDDATRDWLPRGEKALREVGTLGRKLASSNQQLANTQQEVKHLKLALAGAAVAVVAIGSIRLYSQYSKKRMPLEEIPNETTFDTDDSDGNSTLND